MTEQKTSHATFSIERSYAQSPARVFGAWAEPTAKARWFRGPEGSSHEGYALDFRVGGSETVSTHVPGGSVHRYRARYYDILENRRIIYAYDMFIDAVRISVSLATVEFASRGAGTFMRFTEQAAFLDGYEDGGSRERGTNGLLDQLGRALG